MTIPTRNAPEFGGENVAHPSPGREAVGLTALWFGLTGGAAAWSVLTIVVYAIAAQSCYPRMEPLSAPSMGSVKLPIVLLIISCAAIILAVAAGATSIRNWRRTNDETGGDTHWALETGEGRTRFMAVSSVMTSAVFLLAILVDIAAVVWVRPCW